jgi:hypothetical protein
MNPINPPTPAMGVPTAQALPPEIQAALIAAQNSLPPWARWIFAAAIGPLLLTTYNGVKDIWGVPEAQKGIIVQLQKHDETLGDLTRNVSDLTKKVDAITVSVDRISDRLIFMPPSPSSAPSSQPRHR